MRVAVIVLAFLLMMTVIRCIAHTKAEALPDSTYQHLYEVAAGVVHRQRALIEMLNLRGVLSTEDAIAVRQMRGQA